MKKVNIYIIIILVVIHLLVAVGIVTQSVGFNLSKVSHLQIFYALVVGSPIMLTLITYYAFKRLFRNITKHGLIVFLKVMVFAFAVLLMLLLNYVFTYFFDGGITTEYLGRLLILLFISYGTVFIEFKDGKIYVFL